MTAQPVTSPTTTVSAVARVAVTGLRPRPPEPATTGPATTGPVTAGPTTAALATAGPVTAGPATTAPVTAGPATTAPVTAGPTTAALATAGPATTGPATTGPATTGPATTGPTTAAPATTGPATTAPTTAGPATTAPTTTGLADRGLPLTAPARAALAAGDRRALLAAATALAAAAAEETGRTAVVVDGPGGPVRPRLDTSAAHTVGDLLKATADTVPATPGTPGIQLVLDGERPVLRAEFDPAHFAPWFADSFLRTVDHLAGQLTEPERPLADLTLTATADRQTVHGFGHAGFRPPAEPGTLVDRLERGARAGGTAPAVITADGTVGHDELRAESLRTARRLHAGHGARTGTRVALLVGKGRHALSALLGTVRSGAAYVPLDPSQPAARLTEVLADVDAVALVAEPSHLALARTLAGATGTPVLSAAELAAPGGPDEGADPLPPRPGDPAYVIYTSGSTGRPKGVVVRHSAICGYLAWKDDYHALSPDTCLLQIPALSFDSSVSDVFSVLGAGGRLVLVEGNRRLDGPHLRTLAERHAATHVTLVPSLYRAVMDALAAAGTLRVVTVAGEAMPAGLVDRHRRLLPDTRLVNEYGPTENSVGATAFDYPEHELYGTPIGRPLSNTAVSVLDAAGRPVPPGFPGEIQLAGPGLADGYLGRPGPTSAAFVPDADAPGGRRYRTGDLAWWQEDGTLQFLGRADDQVKIRGNRVELGDVEAHLTNVDGVTGAFAVVTAGPDGRPSLVAWVTGPATADPARVRALAAERLPAPLVPDRVLPLESVPLTTNGKADRRALADRAAGALENPQAPPPERPKPPAPGEGTRAPDPEARTEQAAADGDLEETVSGLFRELLGVDETGPDDSFFALGGHSLLAVDLVGLLEERHGLRLEIDELFEGPTVAEICAVLRRAAAPGPTGQGGPPYGTDATAPDDHPLSAAQHRMWTLAHLGGAGATTHHLTDVLRVDGALSGDELAEALTDEAAGHELLRARFLVRDGAPRQRFVPGDRPPLTVVPLEHDPSPARVAETVATLAGRPFDLEHEPPLRAALLTLSPTSSVVVLTVHHIACDGTSAAALVRRVLARIRARRTGTPAPPVPAGRFTDHIARESARLTGPEGAADRAYWHERLAGPLPYPLLPADGERGTSAGPGAAHTVRLPAEAGDRVRALARELGTSVFTVGLTSLGWLLQRFTGQRRMLVGTPVTLREHAAGADVAGPFLNTVVLTADLPPEATFTEAAARVRSAVAGAVAHRGHPFDRLADELPGARDGGRTPLFTVMFTADEPGAAGTDETFDVGPGLTVRREPFAHDVSEFELSFHLDNSGDHLALTAEYDTVLFSAARVRRLLGHWADLLVRAAREPSRSFADQPLPDTEPSEPAHRETRAAGGPGWLLDPFGRPVPIGVPGELHTVDGPTGLAAVRAEDGTLVPRGPAGRPTALADTELRLCEHPDVTDARMTAPDHARVTVRPGRPVTAQALRAFVRRALPAAWVPETVEIVTAPHGTTGGAPAAGDGTADTVTVVGQAVAACLGLAAPAGPDDDFFELGGASLDAIAVAGRLRAALGTDVPPRLVFDLRTPAAIAEALARRAAPATAPPGTQAPAEDDPVPAPADGPAPLSAEQIHIWRALRDGAPQAAFTVLEALRTGPVDPYALREAVEYTAARHDALSSRLVSDGHEPRWQRLSVPRVSWHEDDLRALDEAGRTAALRARTQRHLAEPFDLTAGLLLRARLVRLSDDEHVLLLAVHHIAVDGRSMELITTCVEDAYAALASGRRPGPAPDAPLLADEARRQRARTPDAGTLDGWRQALATAPPDLRLPYDRPRLVRSALIPSELPFTLPTPGARAFARTAGLTPFTAQLTALTEALARYADGRDEVWLATVVSTRGRTGLADVVGPLTATVVLRVPTAGTHSHRDLAQRVAEALLDAHTHPETDLAAVGDLAEREYGIDRARLSQILVVAQEEGHPRPGGLFTPDDDAAAVRPTATAFDLVWSLRAGADDAGGVLTYKAELFDAATAENLVDRYRRALHALLHTPDSPWRTPADGHGEEPS
ncbi:amino acid adenylation domain-containing protein [Streptomyces sp. NPDC017230]|uniref:amino acid adenylation domain-containing protein n=1 Tax=unclassified Streptomyces TaxID=2593676 RepID=UPI00378CB43B